MAFIESGINLSNNSKKKSIQIYYVSERKNKKQKNLKYFLKKKREITFKTAPSQLFART